jgi:cysteine sulfinate desulfinase/cysteine desulfurase-like protein
MLPFLEGKFGNPSSVHAADAKRAPQLTTRVIDSRICLAQKHTS